MEPKSKLPFHMDLDADEDHFSVASGTECTGMIPAAPVNEAAVESYHEIYDIPLADDPDLACHDMQSAKKTKSNTPNPDQPGA